MDISSSKGETKLENLEIKIGKEGLKKQIIQKGASWYTPVHGDEVEVRFSGRIKDGAGIDSCNEGTSFKFKLGQREVIRGWEEGVATMKKGERAIFTIPPRLAYGEAGSPPLIPPSSTLVYDIELITWISIRDLTGDGGVLKKIIKDGVGWATPRNGDEVLVNYEARLEDGTTIAKSDEGVEFQIGSIFLCPAISIGVKTMRRGEKADLAVKFSYGFRQNESCPKSEAHVPANSNLVIHLELISWKSVVDVTGDKKVLKKIVEAGEGFEHPSEGSRVKVIYIGKLDSGTIFETRGSTEEPYEFVCLEEQLNEDLERAVMSMKKGEQAIVTIYRNSTAGEGNLRMSSNSTIHYDVHLIDFTKEKPFWKMDTKEKIEASEKKKHKGNSLFKDGRFWHASTKYEKAARYLEFDHSFTDEEKTIANALRLSCYLNNAACKLRLGDYNEVSRLCTKVLEIDSSNIKALYRRSQAYLKCGDLEKAEADINKALIIQPHNRDVKLLYKELKDKKREYSNYQAEISRNMFSRMV